MIGARSLLWLAAAICSSVHAASSAPVPDQPREVTVRVTFLDAAGNPVPSMAVEFSICTEEPDWTTITTGADGTCSGVITVCEDVSLVFAHIYPSRYNELPDRHAAFLGACAVLEEQAVQTHYAVAIPSGADEVALRIQAQPSMRVSGTLRYSTPEQAWGFVRAIGWHGVAEAGEDGVFRLLGGVPRSETSWISVSRLEFYKSLLRIDAGETTVDIDMGEIPVCEVDAEGTLRVRVSGRQRQDHPDTGWAAGPVIVSEDLRFLVEGQCLPSGDVLFGFDDELELPLPAGRFYILPGSGAGSAEHNAVLTGIADGHPGVKDLMSFEIERGDQVFVLFDYATALPKMREAFGGGLH